LDLKELEQIDSGGLKHWYYRSKFFALKHLLKNIKPLEILDVGAGSGIFSKMLLMNDFCRSACCLDTGYEYDSAEFVNGKKIKYVKGIDLITQDLVLFMDVIEHVHDDVVFLKEYVNKMPEGCYTLISVPAFMFIWSKHDTFLNHQRRYSRAQLEKVVRESGLDIIDIRFFFGLIFPIAACLRIISRFNNKEEMKSDLSPCHPALNSSLIHIHALESKTLFRINSLFGLSIFCLARRPKQKPHLINQVGR